MLVYWQISLKNKLGIRIDDICERYDCIHVVGVLMRCSEESMTAILLAEPDLVIKYSIIKEGRQ